MVGIPQTYKVTDAAVAGGSGGNILIPEGSYKAIIISSEMKDNSSATGQFLALEVAIIEGDYTDTTFTERLNLINPNQKAVEIAYKTLARMAEALGMEETPSDSSQLHNQPLLIEVKTKAGTPWTNNQGEKVEGKDKSEIKAYKPLPKVGVTGAAAPSFAQATPASAAPTAAPKAPWAS